MQRTLEEFTNLKGSKSLTKEQLALFHVKDLKKGWFKRFKNNQLTEEGWANAILSLEGSRGVIPKRKMLQSRAKQYLYLFKNSLGRYKIGVTVDPKKRLATLRGASGLEMEIVCLWTTGDHSAVFLEKAVLKEFSESSTIGEWFACGPEFETIVKSYLQQFYTTGVREICKTKLL